MDNLELFVVVLGDSSPSRHMFPVKASGSICVDEFKELVHAEGPTTLERCKAADLVLWKLNTAIHAGQVNEQVAAFGRDPSAVAEEMNPAMDLLHYFTSKPPRESLHIVVEVPSCEAADAVPHSTHEDAKAPPRTSPINASILSSLERNKEINALIESSIFFLRMRVDAYLRDDVRLPIWQAQQGSDEMRNHIASLQIPAYSSIPSLLLHNLGQSSHDSLLAGRVERLFSPEPKLRFLCNTSGSGKTRLLLEGLWLNWGFYFTARNMPDNVGSSDFGEALKRMEHLTPLTGENYEKVQVENRKFASHRFLLLLYVRMLVFRIYLECAKLLGGITEKHKGQWLLLQVAPDLLLVSDIFSGQFRKLTGASYEVLSTRFEVERKLITDLLGPRRIFCVLDEAQVLKNQFVDCFVSDKDPGATWPILRQVIDEWASRLPGLIVSGTGVAVKEVQTALGSLVAKDGPPPETMTDVGAFDNEEGQRAYFKQYLPPFFLETASGKAVMSRAVHWLHGRHRFTATYLSRLIRTSFEAPHQVLNDFVYGMTDFRPSNWDHEPPLTVKLEKPHGFDFSSLLKISKTKPDLLTTVASFVFEYTFMGKIRRLGGPTGDCMVEYGLSRFKRPSKDGSRMAATDEPLAILGLVNFLTRQHLTLELYLREALNAPIASVRGFAFEPFGAYLLARAFSSPRPLSDVFEFVGECKLADELAELVAFESVNDTFTYTSLNINSDLRSNHALGFSPSTAAETLEWLQNPRGSAFCFPANAVGPDLILVLRLPKDDTVLRVCVQFKHTQALNSGETEKAIRTTDPCHFLSQFKDDAWMISDRSMQHNLVEAIQNLGTGTKKAGAYGILRVVFAHPALPNGDALERAAKDPHRHPVATVRVVNLEPKDSDLGQTILSLASGAIHRKRKRAEESAGYATRSKIQRIGTSMGIGGS